MASFSGTAFGSARLETARYCRGPGDYGRLCQSMARESPTTRREVAAVAAAWGASEADGADPRFSLAWHGSVWISWQPVELRAHREGDSSRIWCSLQPASCCPIAQEAGLDAASSDPPRHPTGREEDRPLAEGSVAR